MVPTPCTVKNPHTTYGWPSTYMVLYSQIRPAVDHVVLWYLLLKKNPSIGGPSQFKLMLFKDE